VELMAGPISVVPTTVYLQIGGPSVNVMVQQPGAGVGAFTVTGGDTTIATAILSSPDGPGPVNLTLTPIAVGATAWTVSGASGFSQNVIALVSPVPVPPLPFTGPETQFPFKPQASESQSQSFTYDVVINEAFPGVVFEPTEPNGQYQEIREVSGDLWLVTNAQFNTNTLTFQQNSPCNPADPAYAWRLMANGNSIRYSAVPTTAPNISVTWVQMFEVDGSGNISSTPLAQTAPVDNLQLEPIWNVGTPTTTGSFEQDVTDTSSAANSFLEKFKVNGTVVWQVRKDGTLVNGSIPSSAIVPASGTATFDNVIITGNEVVQGTSLFQGPATFDSVLTADAGIQCNGNETITGNLAVIGTATFGGSVEIGSNINPESLEVFGPVAALDGETVTGGLVTDTLHIGSEQVAPTYTQATQVTLGVGGSVTWNFPVAYSATPTVVATLDANSVQSFTQNISVHANAGLANIYGPAGQLVNVIATGPVP
jgi:hypothetical protein